MRGRRRGRFGRKARKGRRRASGMTAANKTGNCKANPLIFFNERILEWCFKKTCADCNFFRHGGKRCHNTLPRHIPHGLQPQRAAEAEIARLFASAHPHGLQPSAARTTISASSFASAHPARIATACTRPRRPRTGSFASAHPARIATDVTKLTRAQRDLCLGTSRTDCNSAPPTMWITTGSLPRHIPHGLQPPDGTADRCRKRPLPRHIPHGLQRHSGKRGHNRNFFASAHPARIATASFPLVIVREILCLGTSRTDCNRKGKGRTLLVVPLPRHIPHGLQHKKR